MSNCDVLEPYMETWKHIIRSTKSHIYIYIYIGNKNSQYILICLPAHT